MMPTIVAALGAAFLLWRALIRRRIERATDARLPRGAAGIIAGAEAIDLVHGGEREGVLLLHGFGDTPQTLAELASALHRRGWAVRAPLLPGHGRSLGAFAASRGDDWIAAACTARDAMRQRFERVSIVGLSMGGALASILAADDRDLPALVLMAPYLEQPAVVRRAVRLHRVLDLLVPYLASGSGRSIHDERERAKNLAYRVTTARLLAELGDTAARARAALPRITAPTLFIQSREDNRISVDAAERSFRALGAPDKRLEWLAGTGHVVTVDFGRERVFQLVADWLATHGGPVPAPGASRQAGEQAI